MLSTVHHGDVEHLIHPLFSSLFVIPQSKDTQSSKLTLFRPLCLRQELSCPTKREKVLEDTIGVKTLQRSLAEYIREETFYRRKDYSERGRCVPFLRSSEQDLVLV